MIRRAIVVFVLATALACGSAQPTTVRLRFTAVVGDEPLVFNQPVYDNPGGEGMFGVRDFLLYVSNIRLDGPNGNYAEPDSYHLARFDNATKSYEIQIDEVPRDTYSRVTLSIGLDEQANTSIGQIGDVNPNGRMAWNWEVGHKFVLVEGSLRVDDEIRPLVYHVGFTENRKTLEFDLSEPDRLWSPEGLAFEVDLMKLWTGSQTIDMQVLPNVKFDRTDAALLAENYASMISLKQRP
jgi:hypothetical protein